MKLTFDDYIHSFIVECEVKELSKETIKWYTRKLTAFKEFVDAQWDFIQSPDDINRTHLKEFIVHLRNKSPKLSPPYIRGFGRTLTVFFNFLENEYGLNNPSRNLTLPKMPKKHFPIFTTNDIKGLLAAPEKRGLSGFTHYCMMYTMLDTGMRVGELVNFELDDVNFDRGVIRVLGKGAKERLVPFGKELKRVRLKYKAVRPESTRNTFFVSANGRPYTPSGVCQFVRRHGKKAGVSNVRISPHTFRHTFATMYILNGGDTYSLQKILGHASPAIVQIYVNMTAKNVIEQHKKFSPGDSLRLTL